ncbi:MAG: HsdM family class I SAM-dependent methyltransferase [Chitinophagales bacterium]
MGLGSNSEVLPNRLAVELGKDSVIHSRVTDFLLGKLKERTDRQQVIREWEVGMGRFPDALADENLQLESERLVCLETYYSLVVQLSAWYHLVVTRGGNASLQNGLSDLLNGNIFRQVGISNLGLDGLPGWHTNYEEWPSVIREMIGVIWRLFSNGNWTGDLFQALYENLITQVRRHDLGEHYTPGWLVEHVLNQTGYYGQEEAFILDPACGSGTFLVEILRRRKEQLTKPEDDMERVVGFDLNPLAVLAARVNYLYHSGYTPSPEKEYIIPVFQIDSITEGDNSLWDNAMDQGLRQKFNYVVGNPPWVNWESLKPEYRQATMEYWREYGLFSHHGMDVILGKGRKDLSTLLTLASAHKYLKDEGKLAFLITQSVFKSGGAAEGFRRFELPDGTPLRVSLVEDMAALKPFPGASNRTAIIYLEKGLPTTYPVSYSLYKELPRSGDGQVLKMAAMPVEENAPASPWLTCLPECIGPVKKMLGESVYQAREGANTGGANGILWVEIVDQSQNGLVTIRNLATAGKDKVLTIERIIEEDLIYPLARGKDLDRWQVNPSAAIIMTQDPVARRGLSLQVMERSYPCTLEYLKTFEPNLQKRAAYRRYFTSNDPFYSMFNVGEYTLAPIKVAWHRFGSKMKAAVLEGGVKPVICQETHALVVCRSSDEAWYLAGLLNSLPIEYALTSYSMTGGKSFASPHLFKYIRFPFYTGEEKQKMIATAARGVATGQVPAEKLDREIVALYNITYEELALMRRARKDAEIQDKGNGVNM